jgi:hypothetical protein
MPGMAFICVPQTQGFTALRANSHTMEYGEQIHNLCLFKTGCQSRCNNGNKRENYTHLASLILSASAFSIYRP